jgi:signal peptidase I
MFSLILLVAVIITGVIVLADKMFLAPRRRAELSPAAEAVIEAPMSDGTKSVTTSEPQLPLLVDYARAFFPVVLLVFVLRSFIVEPFRIPSGSMIPTLQIGDFILVNKFAYGIRFPVIHKKIIPVSKPERGDVAVFRFPVDPETNFIKRVIGLPGDKIVYDQKRLTVNGKLVDFTELQPYEYTESGRRQISSEQIQENLGEHEYSVINDNRAPPRGHTIEVQPNHYFVMGDNRDFSNDSRSWGFVPEENLVGKAIFIWMSWDGENNSIRWSRLGSRIP